MSSFEDLTLLNREVALPLSNETNVTAQVTNFIENHPQKQTSPPSGDLSNRNSFFDDSRSIEEDMHSHEILTLVSSASQPSRKAVQELPLVQAKVGNNTFTRHSLIQPIFSANEALLEIMDAAVPITNARARRSDTLSILPETQQHAEEDSIFGTIVAASNWCGPLTTESTSSIDEMFNPLRLNSHTVNSSQPSILSIPLWLRTLTPLICTETLLNLYFTEFGCSWPLLHRSRLLETLEQQPLELLYSVALIGTLYVHEISHHEVSGGSEANSKEALRSASRRVHEWLLESLSAYLNHRREEGFGCLEGRSEADLTIAQALLLNIIYGICIDQVSLRVRLCASFGTLTEWIREAGFFQHDNTLLLRDTSSPGVVSTEADEYERWITTESQKRLVFAAFRLDCYLSLCYDRGPIIRYQEVCVPLVHSDAMWDVAHPDAWRLARQLEPNGRLNRTFSSLCASAFAGLTQDAMPVLLEEDYELALCAMQARLWEDTLQQHEQTLPSPSNRSPGLLGRDDGMSRAAAQAAASRSEAWHVQLEYWRTHRNRSEQVNAHYSSPAHRQRTRFNGTMMYLLSYLRIHADTFLIRRLITSLDHHRGRPAFAPVSEASRSLESRVSAWAGSRNARVALRCAAQIFQVYVQEVGGAGWMFQRVDPMGVGCMFRAALVVWAYARSTLACDTCMGVSLVYTDDLQSKFFGPQAACELSAAGVDLDLHAISGWVSRGGKASINGVPVCACSLPLLMGSFVSVMRRCTGLLEFVTPLIDILENLKYGH